MCGPGAAWVGAMAWQERPSRRGGPDRLIVAVRPLQSVCAGECRCRAGPVFRRARLPCGRLRARRDRPSNAPRWRNAPARFRERFAPSPESNARSGNPELRYPRIRPALRFGAPRSRHRRAGPGGEISSAALTFRLKLRRPATQSPREIRATRRRRSKCG